ncbi:7tm 6 domain containing protein [Asbolus verrucosus]|uniref:7tm 6 domain containing protein n=1 Tax=Asbolus verrucosus TaxID=1661398 RepID=A0A482VIB5_ASBVE|nr:7tm 6 domain containing protein [Asbolus verrucosus]
MTKFDWKLTIRSNILKLKIAGLWPEDKSVKEHRLPFLAWYPFNEKKSPFYEITYIYQIVSISFIAMTTLSINTLIAALNMYIAAQFDILCDDLRNLRNVTDALSADFNVRLINCVNHHKEILRFAEDSNKFFNWIVFLQFFISAISIGITMFQLTMVDPLSSEFFLFCPLVWQ